MIHPENLIRRRSCAQVLRRVLGCQLPIEIIYDGEHEMSQGAVAKFEVGPLLMALRCNSPCGRTCKPQT